MISLLVSDFKDQCGSVPSISVAVLGLTDLPKSRGAMAPPAPPGTTGLTIDYAPASTTTSD